MRKFGRFAVIFMFLSVCAGVYGIAEEITLTTYYPAPYGAYEELIVDRELTDNTETVTGVSVNIDETGTNAGTVTGLSVDTGGVADGTVIAAEFTGGNVNIDTGSGTDTDGTVQIGGTSTVPCALYVYAEWMNGIRVVNESSGIAISAYGHDIGVFAYGDSGIYGRAEASGGKGVEGVTNAADAYSGYFSGGLGVYVSGNLEVTGTITKSGVGYAHPDYVFAPDYAKMRIEELKTFVTQNKHLPNMPSKKHIIKNGVDMFEQNRLMLEKLEEAYLYIFELEDRISKLEHKMNKIR